MKMAAEKSKWKRKSAKISKKISSAYQYENVEKKKKKKKCAKKKNREEVKIEEENQYMTRRKGRKR